VVLHLSCAFEPYRGSVCHLTVATCVLYLNVGVWTSPSGDQREGRGDREPTMNAKVGEGPRRLRGPSPLASDDSSFESFRDVAR